MTRVRTVAADHDTALHNTVNKDTVDLVVVGGGLAGLITASLVARQGRSVVVLEQGREPGGRGLTNQKGEVFFNLGPRALYCHGHAFRLLRELAVPFTGQFPNPGKSLLWIGERSFATPKGLSSLLGTRLLTWSEKWRLFRLLSELPKLDLQPWNGVTTAAWIAQTAGTGNLALFLRALLRLVTYGADAEQMSAGAALAQLQLSLAGNVWYLDRGWQTLIDGLRERATACGTQIQSSARVMSVEQLDGRLLGVRLADGRTLPSRAVVLTAAPAAARELLQLPAESALARFANHSVPSTAACLDVALDRLPIPQQRFALGLDQRLYFSVHSAAANLGPPGVAVLHVMKYLHSGETTASSDLRAELEGFLDRVQPGWRSLVRVQRFLPQMVVAHALPLAADQGLAGRPPVAVAERPGVFLAGDWVGARGMLADASAASAEAAAQGSLQYLSQSPARSFAHAAG